METKRVLYIGTPFFGYYRHIIKEFENQGYQVDYYNDRPSESPFIKGLIKIKRNLANKLVEDYFEKILCKTKENVYSLVFIVNCKVFTSPMIQRLKESQKSAKFVLYMWDSLELYPNSKDIISAFDKAYSFDTNDCDNIEKLIFLPLFYNNEYKKVGDISTISKQYDMISVCTAHENRYKIMRELFPKLESKGIKIFSYMFLNKFQYLYNKIFLREFRYSKKSDFKFEPLPEQKYIEILEKTNTVFDIPHSKQNGLTMRTIETFGANRKLITTNMNIKKYNFYDENNILVINENNLTEIEEFLESEYKPIDKKIYKQYSLGNWIKTIITGDVENYLI